MTASRISMILAGAAAALSIALSPAALAKEAAPTAFDPVAHKRVVEVSEQLRCLVCQNQSIADSNAELAVDLRNQVIEQVKAGKSNEEIVNYMVDRYGDFVLYNPPFKASTVILWVGPAVLFFGAVIASVCINSLYAGLLERIHATLAFLPLLPTSPLLFYVTIFLLAAGTGIGALGSYISLRKFLRV